MSILNINGSLRLFASISLALFAAILVSIAGESAAASQPSRSDYLRLASETESNLQTHILDKFFPAAADDQGPGFHENFGQDWRRLPGKNKSIVYQSRLTWTSAQAAKRFPAKSSLYLEMTRRGAACLANTMWDRQGGGFYWTVSPNGQHTNAMKQMYGHAFGIYALAASYEVTKDLQSLELAKEAFGWLEAHAHDGKFLGYFENVGPDGKPANPEQGNAIGAGAGQKSMNTSIHLLEALTALYQAWPDPLVGKRVQELLDICRDRFYAEPGYLIQYQTADWKPLIHPDSFGHDVETGFLMVEGAESLHSSNQDRYWTAARHLVDHALLYGWDKDRGGLYDAGTLNRKGELTGDLHSEKIWWVQAEHLNALLLLHERFGKETDQYWRAFIKQWNWIVQSQIDPAHGGWLAVVHPDGKPISKDKANMWTECYHQGRAMLVVSERLRKLAEGH